MPFMLSEEEQMIEKVVREFARDQVGLEAPHDNDRHDRFPDEILQSAAQLGLCGMSVPEDRGGAGVPPAAYAVAILELAKVDPAGAAVLAVHNAALRPLLRGPDDVATELVSKAIAGEIATLLVTEEAGGVDKRRMTTTARPTDDGHQITGRKAWATAAAGAKHFVVAADVQDAGTTLFHLPAGAPGVSLAANDPIMGLRAAGVRTVHISHATGGTMLGEPGGGEGLLEEARPWLQVGAAAALCGAVAGAFDAAARFAEDRVQFGKAIGHYQAVSDTVTSIDLNLRAATALTLQAASRLDQDDAGVWAARAKAFATQMAIPATRKALRVQGGTGFMREGGTERFLRDVRALQFLGEPVQMQFDTLKRELLDLEFEATP